MSDEDIDRAKKKTVDAAHWDLERVVWNGLGSEYVQSRGLANFKAHFRWLLDSLQVPPSPGWIVMEAGDGTFGWSHLYRQYFDKVYGADIKDCTEFHPGVERIICDFSEAIPLPDQSLDLVVTHSVLEHVLDVPAALGNFYRVLKRGGHLLVTIHPLYYSAAGSHIAEPKRLTNWEHLDPASEHFMIKDPRPGAVNAGHDLNQMKWSDFLGYLGAFPWSIIRSELSILDQPIPEWVDRNKFAEMDLRMKGFRLLLQKQRHW